MKKTKQKMLQSLDKRDDSVRRGSTPKPILSPLFPQQETAGAALPPKPSSKSEAEVSPPKFFEFKKKALLKDQLIKSRLDDYAKTTKAGGIEYTPGVKDKEEYLKKLKELNTKDLSLMGSMKEYKLKLDVLDRLKSIDKKKHAVVTIFNDNKTTDTGVITCYDRTFSRTQMRYIVMSERGIYDPEFKMSHFYYYANQPFPILFKKNVDPEAVADARLLDKTIKMQVIEALANINISKTINIILVFLIFNLIISVLTLLLSARASGII